MIKKELKLSNSKEGVNYLEYEEKILEYFKEFEPLSFEDCFRIYWVKFITENSLFSEIGIKINNWECTVMFNDFINRAFQIDVVHNDYLSELNLSIATDLLKKDLLSDQNKDENSSLKAT